jgi:uncharacterized protein
MWAAARGYSGGVEFLVKSGANVNLKNQGGYTAMMIAEFNGYADVVRILKAAGTKE